MTQDNGRGSRRRKRIRSRRKGTLFAANAQPRAQLRVAIKGECALVTQVRQQGDGGGFIGEVHFHANLIAGT